MVLRCWLRLRGFADVQSLLPGERKQLKKHAKGQCSLFSSCKIVTTLITSTMTSFSFIKTTPVPCSLLIHKIHCPLRTFGAEPSADRGDSNSSDPSPIVASHNVKTPHSDHNAPDRFLATFLLLARPLFRPTSICILKSTQAAAQQRTIPRIPRPLTTARLRSTDKEGCEISPWTTLRLVQTSHSVSKS